VTDPTIIAALLEKAHGKLEAARILLDAGRPDDAVSRAYYAVFNAMSALLYKHGLVFSSHGQVIGAFNREFVKTGIFPSGFSRQITGLFEDRQAGDYDPAPSITSEAAEIHLKNAAFILSLIRTQIDK
jgi:uncharacterized protein (UPF0332 family)